MSQEQKLHRGIRNARKWWLAVREHARGRRRSAWLSNRIQLLTRMLIRYGGTTQEERALEMLAAFASVTSGGRFQ